MREVFNIAACSASQSVLSVSGTNRASQPGYLDLPPERIKELFCHQPIEELYELDEHPFARGKYASVRRCRCRQSNRLYAAKFARKRRRSGDVRADVLHEAAVLDACRGSNRVVSLHRIFETTHDVVLLLDLAAGGEVQTLLDQDDVPEEAQVARIMAQVLDGLVFLHSINVAHLDLKPQNLVLTGEFPDCDVKLCDFGISRYLSDGADIREILGTPDYVAPEVLSYEPISLATDMWSVGVLVYVLLTGCSPFGGETKQETFCNISQCRLDFPDDLFEDISEEAKDFMKKLMVKDPSQRLSARECLQHSWFAYHKVQLSSPSTSVTEKSSLPPSTPQQETKPTRPAAPETATPIPALLPPSSAPSPSSSTPPISSSTPTQSTPTSSSTVLKSTPTVLSKSAAPFVAATAAKLVAPTKPAGVSSTPKPSPIKTKPVDRLRPRPRSPTLPHRISEEETETATECIFKFRKVLVVDYGEDQVTSPPRISPSPSPLPSPPQSIHGSTGSSLYSDNSISDSGSELSVDSSSDRSSIISLDDTSPWDMGCARVGAAGRTYNVWDGSTATKPPTRRYMRECNGSFARAFSRFAAAAATTSTSPGPTSPPKPIVLSRLVPLRAAVAAAAAANASSSQHVLEVTREQVDVNSVLIREMREIKPGGRYARFSEVKCESVQSRIRKLQVNGALT